MIPVTPKTDQSVQSAIKFDPSAVGYQAISAAAKGRWRSSRNVMQKIEKALMDCM